MIFASNDLCKIIIELSYLYLSWINLAASATNGKTPEKEAVACLNLVAS